MDREAHDGQGQGFVGPCVMLMLQRAARETEELRALVAAFGFRQQAADMAATLRRLQDEGLVDSNHPPEGDGEGGPTYVLTATGERWLASRSQELNEPARLVARFLDRYTSAPRGWSPGAGGRKSAGAVGSE